MLLARLDRFGWRVVELSLVTVTLFAGGASHVQAQTFTVLHSFDNTVQEPLHPLEPGVIAQGRDGFLYSTAPLNASGGAGAVFRVAPSGAFNVVHAFNTSDGSMPRSGLTLGTDGFFYGSTSGGGIPLAPAPDPSVGTVFKTTPDGSLTVLHNFRASEANGTMSVAPPVEGPDGNFYGQIESGGSGGLLAAIQIYIE